MKRVLFLSGLALLALSVSACGGFDRAEHDKKLAKGCEAAVKGILPATSSIESVKGATFGYSETLGNGKDYRTVKLSVVQKDESWHTGDKEYECSFIESLTVGGLSMKSDLYQLKDGETTYGRDDKGNVIGTLNDWLALTDKAQNAMSR
jgi:hypothetical protein